MINIEIEIEKKNWRIISVYKKKKEYLKNLEEEIERERWRKMIIEGDFNARTADQGRITWNKDKEEKEDIQKIRH